ncbi:DNA repair exonuclease [Escherichia phage aaroes]|uniref:Putative phosphoesterase n=1 Tax=Escherichia phage aaroes TaxID=2696376 RepID=A0A6B9WPH1_9CAUD|nr:DNA repair exonuclease [Escherichia phage aaroes]QHR65718.1 putative phosphoesterase [Escherichia phage aaroes]
MKQIKITDEQFINERKQGKTYKQIANEYGMNVRSIERRAARLAKQGKVTTIGSPGFGVTGESKLIDKDGNVVMTWIKTSKDREQLEALMQAAMDAFSEEVPRLDPQPESQKDYSETLSLYPIFDMHLGAMAHKHECGENWDTATAERVMNNFIDYSIQCAPDSEKAVLLIGGDMLHSDGLEAVTPASGHVLDQDSRYAKLVYVAIRSVRRAITKLLSKHKNVEIQIIEGNHDQSGMIWLRAAMAAAYENEPRVHVDVSPRVVHHTQYGKTFLAYHHGHTIRKPETLLMMCAADWREDFGNSKMMYTHVGHWHHQTVTETSLGIVEVHSTMAAKDAYAARGGWRSRRRAAVIVYDKEYGEVGRFMHYPEMADRTFNY